jgi:hypothetical protein
MEQRDALAVSSVELLELLAMLTVIHPAVGEDAIHIHHQHPHATSAFAKR